MNTFEDRKKGFEAKYLKDQEVQFKVNALKNKFLAEWAAKQMQKNDNEREKVLALFSTTFFCHFFIVCIPLNFFRNGQ